ncbi:MAG: KEOPS complex subunit Pcc1 [Nitrososphaera sp.]|uniref:KEOPS complex subunit Pcc1 n=1 Tax=Candidatus Nitrososphaera gargensis TaxID=497727 RepID=UPI00164F4E45|nr:KEOPS complex subunit Pcc1 [Candidatus Nitrososphaera gargensis]
MQRQLDVTVSVDVPFSSSAEAKAVVKALIPDNVNFPKGLSMRIFSKGATLAIQLTGKNVPAATVLSTLDEVLEHISISKKVMAD